MENHDRVRACFLHHFRHSIASTLIIRGIFTDSHLIFLRQPSDNGAGWLWLIFAVNPGLFEEMGLRGLLFNSLRRTYSEKTVIRLTSILFGLFHFTGLVNRESVVGLILISIMATTFGLSWGYMVAKTGSVVPSMMVHYLVNAFSEVLLQANTTKDELILLHILSRTILYPILSFLLVRSITQSQIPNWIFHSVVPALFFC
jgi:membrane protease YdiL (CAAX protease family)